MKYNQHLIGPIPLSHTYTKSGMFFRLKEVTTPFNFSVADWENWTAALVTDASVRDMLVSAVRNYAADGLSSAPLGDWYETTNGGPEGFRARPVVGGHLALVRRNSPPFNSAKAHAELAARCVSERCYETFLPLTLSIHSMYYIVLVFLVFAVIHRSRLQTQRTRKQRSTIPPQA